MGFANKVIILTGAGWGIGAHAAKHLAKKRGNVALVDRNHEQLNKVCEQIRSTGAPAPLAILADVSNDAERIISETVNHFGNLNVLINCAGIFSLNSIEDIDLNEYDRIMKTNVRSVIHLSKLAVPHLARTKGNILNVSSAAGLRVISNQLAYCISKGAVNQLTKCAELELAPKGIRVNSINPVAIRTPLFENGMGLTTEQAAQFFDNFKKIYPLGRVGEVTDTTAAIEYLISDSAEFITGMLLPVDGGALTAEK